MTPRLSIIVPIYNEQEHLEQFLQALDEAPCPLPREFVFIDDASKDRSLEILRAYRFKNPEVKILTQTMNQGKGAALHRGILEAAGQFLMIQDADFEYDLRDVPALIEPLMQDRADVVYGSRFKKSGLQVHRTFHYLVNRFLTILSNAFSGLYLTDMETCYKAFRTEIIQNIDLESQRFGFEPEVTAKVARLRARVFEIPISYFPRTYLEGKKITWKDGLAALWHLVYFNFVAPKTRFFKHTMPVKYLINRRQWL